MSSSSPSDELLDASLAELVAEIVQSPNDKKDILIASLDSRIRNTALPLLFGSISLPDDARYFTESKAHLPSPGCFSVLIAQPAKYGSFVKRLEITDPLLYANVDASPTTLLQFDLDDASNPTSDVLSRRTSDGLRLSVDGVIEADENEISPIPESVLRAVIKSCSNLEEFLWLSSTPPPEGLCEVLANHCHRLTTCSFTPTVPLLFNIGNFVSRSPPLPKWDAPSLLQLQALHQLTSLHITRLSQQGARSLAELFVKMGSDSYSNLEDVSLDFVWLDDSLCEKLAAAGRRIKRLTIGTSGTKLTDKGIATLFEGCDALEELSLIDVQGRLSKSIWAKIDALPPSFHTLRVVIPENGPHHSWTVDHLQSLSSLPLDGITNLSITRSVHPFDIQVDDVAVVKPVPRDFLDKLKEKNDLKILECDWWGWSPDDLTEVLEDNPELEVVKVTFNAPITRLFAMTSTFANLLHLRRLTVTIPTKHSSHGLAPSLQAASPNSVVIPIGLLTPSASPITSNGIGKPVMSPTSNKSLALPIPPSDPSQTPPTTFADLFGSIHNSNTFGNSASTANLPLPPVREVRKFVQRCPKLELLEWTGRNARGKWLISRDPCAKSSINAVKVEHFPPPMIASEKVMERAHREYQANLYGWNPALIERLGHRWQGAAAEAYFAEAEQIREAELAAAAPSDLGSAASSPVKSSTSGRRKPSLAPLNIAGISPVSPSKSSARRLSVSVEGNNAPVVHSAASIASFRAREAKRAAAAANGTIPTVAESGAGLRGSSSTVSGKSLSKSSAPKGKSGGEKEKKEKKEKKFWKSDVVQVNGNTTTSPTSPTTFIATKSTSPKKKSDGFSTSRVSAGSGGKIRTDGASSSTRSVNGSPRKERKVVA